MKGKSLDRGAQHFTTRSRPPSESQTLFTSQRATVRGGGGGEEAGRARDRRKNVIPRRESDP